jgi:predicted ATPase/transcriptional regulator with GAF, ATPase, and Fis domain/tRNA A-37 threonylcarbamoyl transferase component Bud32
MQAADYELIQELTRSDWYYLHKARRIDNQKNVLLKSPLRNPPDRADLDLLEREFEILQGLSLPGVPGALEMHSGERNCYLVMEDKGDVTLHSLIVTQTLSLELFFKIAIQLSTILGELHQRNLIHRNITPRNIFVHPETFAVQLGDFSRASRNAAEVQSPGSLLLLGEALPYISPEQTGRMNRAVDYRTDFYSLGVVLYEILTGACPFRSIDRLELIHWHIARTPSPPADINLKIPLPISQIVMKLLSKTAEDRYQSAFGIAEDLQVCERAWTAQQEIAPFPLGLRDISDRFLVSQRLYGREQEVKEMLRLFDEACEGPTAMMLVAGYSGIGKTSLIQELYKPIVRERGYFTSGKFDQIARLPYGAFIQAFRGLCKQFLTEGEDELALWRARLSQALGVNGGVIAEVIPEIELILGKQPVAPLLEPAEAQNRFRMVFQNFVKALARKGQPLVIFLDDLQWADSATLNLLQPLLTGNEVQYLFLIGAYRDNEVDAGHSLARALSGLEADGARVHQISLEHLSLSDLSLLIQDTLHADRAEAEPLARLVLQKTGGNPFFVIQFLKILKQEGFLAFDHLQGRWAYQIDDIAGAAMTDNVVDLMTRKIQRLSSQTQRVLTLASCIGNSFDQDTFALISEQSPEEVAEDLREAIDEGLILPLARHYQTAENGESETSTSVTTYSFQHDRVQQAAYALIPAEQKQSIHLRVGRLLFEGAGLKQSEEKLFDIVHHLNLGSSLITEEAQRLALAQLNLSAGQKAKSSTAYEAALDYLKAGIRLLREERWQSDYDTAFALHLEAAECLNLCGNFEEAEEEIEGLLERAKRSLDKARAYRLRIVQRENLSRYSEALVSARESLALFGVAFPDTLQGKQEALEGEIAVIQSLLGSRQIATLIDLPVMSDPEIRCVMDILTTIWSSAYISGDQALTRLLSATLVRLSLAHGNCEESAYGYATHAITVGPLREDYQAAYEFGSLALRVNERFNDSKRRAKICQQFQAHASLWRRPLKDCISYAQEARRSGFETGDFTYAIYGAYTETWVAIAITQDLARFVRDYSPNLALFKKLKVASIGDAQKALLNWARALQGETRAPISLSDEEFNEQEYRETYRDNPFFLICYAVTKMQLCYLFGEYRKALEAARIGRQIVHHLEGTIWIVLFDFWNALILAANYPGAQEDERRTQVEEMEKARHAFAVLAENCPENYLCQSLLISAEIERLLHQELAAADLYERAIGYALETGMVQHLALANELCARFWLDRGQQKVAAVFMAEARAGYAQWGAAAKVEELERRYPDLFSSQLPAPSSRSGAEATTAPTVDSFDIATAMMAAQAIAGVIDLEKLLERLMSIAIQNAGAERGSLILEQDNQAFVRAEGTTGSVAVKMEDAIRLEESMNVSPGIVNYVRRTFDSVVLADARIDDRYSSDPYVARQQPRSILCAPVLKQGRLLGVLYLENNLATDAFTTDRVRLLQLIASEAAISLENARLYDEMKQEVERRRKTEETLRAIVEGTAAVTGDDFFSALVRHLASAIGVRYAFATECTDRTKVRVRTLAFWSGESLTDNIEYDLALTPCERVIAGQVSHHVSELQTLFPGDTDLVTLGAESFLGLPMADAFGEIIGHLAVLDDKPMPNAARAMSVMQIFAARAGAELQRLKAEHELRKALSEVEQLKNRLQNENVYLQEEIRREHHFEEIVGSSPPLLDLLRQVEIVAPTDSTALINGETGTGKELIAHAIHSRSTRKARPLVKVNCGAISAGLVESELFGHVKGAFTGAIERRVGRFELADKGTLFLDEVSELPLETQVKLLRVLQEGEFEAVGSSKTIKVDVRIIAASNRSLEAAVREGRFRADLYYRLNVFPLVMPPLRERPTDIPQLVMFFLSRFSKKFGKKIETVSQDAMQLLLHYAWPGNVRELQNIMERAVVLSQGTVLTLNRNLIPALEVGERLTMTKGVGDSTLRPSQHRPAQNASQTAITLEEVERRHILDVVEQSGWVIEGPNGAAKLLNLHPNTLRSRMKKLGIKRTRHEIS